MSHMPKRSCMENASAKRGFASCNQFGMHVEHRLQQWTGVALTMCL